MNQSQGCGIMVAQESPKLLMGVRFSPPLPLRFSRTYLFVKVRLGMKVSSFFIFRRIYIMEKDKIIEAHQFCTNNKESLLNNKKCRCFYCLKIFNSLEIYLKFLLKKETVFLFLLILEIMKFGVNVKLQLLKYHNILVAR